MLKYGIMSVSSIAPRFIAAVREANAGEIVALSSRSLKKAMATAAELNIKKAYGDHDLLLEDNDVNVVYISSINSEHYSMAKKALEHGKHVVCEKPCTTSFEQSRELFELAKARGLFFMEAQKMLFLPAIKAVADIIKEGRIGKICMIEANHSFPGDYNDWMYDKESGGGPLLSSGIYAVQLIEYLFGKIENVKGVKSSMPNGVEWQYVISGQTESGVLFCIKNSTKCVLDNKARIYGDKGFIEIPNFWKAQKALVYTDGSLEPAVEEYPAKFEMMYEALHVKECIEKGLITSPVVTRELTLSAISVLEKIIKQW